MDRGLFQTTRSAAPQHAQVGGDREGEPEWQHGEEIDDAGDVPPPRGARAQVLLPWKFALDPDPGQTLEGDSYERGGLDDDGKLRAPTREVS